VLVQTRPHFTRTVPYLDELNRPAIALKFQPDGTSDIYGAAGGQLQILQYNNTLGSAGSWTFGNATDENGNNIMGFQFEARVYNSSFYRRPSFWASGSQSSGHITNYVKMSGQDFKWKGVYSATSRDVDGSSVALVTGNTVAYDCIVQENVLAAGYETKGTLKQDLNSTVFWATKFTARSNSTIDRGDIFLNQSLLANWQMAVYNSTFNLLGVSAERNTFGAATESWIWNVAFSTPFNVIYGQDYWVAFRVDYSTNIRFMYSASTSPVNGTFCYSLPYTSSFPSTIAPLSTNYFNRTITVLAIQSDWQLRGFGANEYATEFTSTGTNSTVSLQICQFYTTASDLSGLSYGKIGRAHV